MCKFNKDDKNENPTLEEMLGLDKLPFDQTMKLLFEYDNDGDDDAKRNFDEELEKEIAEVEKMAKEAIESIEKDKTEQLPSSNRKCTVVFTDVPTSLDEPINILLKENGVITCAVFDVNRCHSDEVLKSGDEYYVTLTEMDGKTYLVNYSRVHFNNSFFILTEDLDIVQNPYYKSERVAGFGPKIACVFDAYAYNVTPSSKGMEFVLWNDEITVQNCYYEPISDDKEKKITIENGEKYNMSGYLHRNGFYVYAVEKPAKEGLKFDDDDSSELYILGKVHFDMLPDPDDEILPITIDTGEKMIKTIINRKTNFGDESLSDGETYRFSYIPHGDSIEIQKFSRFGNSAIDTDALIGKIDRKIFDISCLEKQIDTDVALIEVSVRSKLYGIKKDSGGYKFSVKFNNKRCDCVYDVGMNPACKIGSLEIGKDYDISGNLAGKTLYVNTIILVTDEIKNAEVSMNPEFAGKLADLSPSARNEIAYIVENGTKHELIEYKHMCSFLSNSEMMEKFNLIREYYPKEIQIAIDKIIKNKNISNNQERKILDVLVNTFWGQQLKIVSEYKYLKEKLDEKFYGQEYLKEQIIKVIIGYKYKKEKKGINILLVGPPGVGKTSMFRYAAQLAGIPFEKVSLGGVDTPYFINGTPRLYDNATIGHIMGAIHKVGNRCIIMLDECDKLSYGNEGNPITAFYNLLDREELFIDNMIEEGIDTSDIIFVLTANDANEIPPAIMDRVTEIFVPDYTEEEKVIIAKEYIVKNQMEEFDWGECRVCWDDGVFNVIANRYSLTNGVREIKENTGKIIRNALCIGKKEGAKKIQITENNIETFLDIQPCRQTDIQHEITGLKNKFKAFKYNYPPKTREQIMALFARYDSICDANDREVMRKRLEAVVNFVPSLDSMKVSLDRVREELDKSHYGMDNVKETIMTYMAVKNINADCPRCIWLDGPAGTGKTTIAEAIARATDRKFVKIPLNGIESSKYIKGFETTWKNSSYGKIMEAISQAGTDELVILLDEIDKMSNSNANGNPYDALHDVLDDSATFTDTYTGIPVYLGNILFIATSNYPENVPITIQDRMEKISLTGYSENQKINIAENYILPQKLKNYKIDGEVISSEMIESIVRDYCKSYGVRDIEKTLDKLLRKFVLASQQNKNNLKIDEGFINKVLGAKPIRRGNFAENNVPGIARALGVAGNMGVTFAVQVMENPYAEDDVTTGLAKQSILDSITISKLLISKMLGKKLPKLHIHFGEGGIEKDGPSAGITIFSAMYSALTNQEIDFKNIGMTGEIDINGDVWPIGGLELKILAAERSGCSMVIIPAENYRDLVESGKLHEFKCNIVPVHNVSELCNILFKQKKNH